MLMVTYLVIGGDKLRHSVQSRGSVELAQIHYGLEVQQLLGLLHLAGFFCFFLLFHGIPYWPWNGPMIDWYVSFLTSLLADLVILMNMKAAS